MKRDAQTGATHSADGLCYLAAAQVEWPGGTLADVLLCNKDDESVGTVDGVLIHPPSRRVRFFVVHVVPINGFFLVPIEEIVHVDAAAGVARLEAATGELRLARFDPRAVRTFSDDDAITAMCAPHAA
jgi:hypothetical protein